MKKFVLILFLILLVLKISYSQNNESSKTIILPDSSELVFHHTPFVNIEIRGAQIKRTFDNNKSIICKSYIQNILDSLDYISLNNINNNNSFYSKDYVNMLALNQKQDELDTKLSDISNQYSQRFVCFIFEYGFTSTPELELIIEEGNNNSFGKAVFGSANFYEIFFKSANFLVFVIFDNKLNKRVYMDYTYITNKKTKKLFSYKATLKMFNVLKKRLGKTMIWNLRKTDRVFQEA